MDDTEQTYDERYHRALSNLRGRTEELDRWVQAELLPLLTHLDKEGMETYRDVTRVVAMVNEILTAEMARVETRQPPLAH